MPPKKRGKRPGASGDDHGNRNAQEDGEPFSEKGGRLQKPEFDEAEDTKASKRRENVGFANIFDGALGFGNTANLRGFGGASTDASLSSSEDDDTIEAEGKLSANRTAKDNTGDGRGIWDPAGLDIDFRNRVAGDDLPSGFTVVNAKGVSVEPQDLKYETQEDSSTALVLTGDMVMRMCLGPEHNLFHWMTAQDGKIHEYTLTLAIKLDRLPTAHPLPLFHGRGVRASSAVQAASNEYGKSDSLECVQVYKNGGIGALGQVGVAATALKAERWAWVF